jgi:ribosomal protein L11 methyltransferase
MTYPFVQVTLPATSADEAADLLLSAGASGLESRDAGTMIATAPGLAVVIGWFGEVAAAEAAGTLLRRALGAPAEARAEVEVGGAEDPGWREAWRAHFRPMRFGRRLWVAPPDDDPPPASLDDDAAVVRIVPSGAFGTGTHESTALMLELLDGLVAPGARVLDVGCGSGILALAAARLGAGLVRGIDVDPEAVEVARRNAEENGLGARCRLDDTPLERVDGGAFDLVLANLSAPVLVRLKHRLAGLVGPGGWLLWSGLLEADVGEVGPPPELALVHDRRRNGWAAQAWRRLAGPGRGEQLLVGSSVGHRRLVVPGLDLDRELIALPPGPTRHVARVLRLGPGDELLLLDGRGGAAGALVESSSADAVVVRVVSRARVEAPVAQPLHLIQALPKGGGLLDEIVRRATELGVASIRPALAERSVARPTSERAGKRLERWRRIAAEAARQCCRSHVPEVHPLAPLDLALRAAPEASLRVALHEGELVAGLASLLLAGDLSRGVTLVIGPEGGLGPDEVALAREIGFAVASVGPRVLRTPTAAIAACAVAQLHLGALEP